MSSRRKLAIAIVIPALLVAGFTGAAIASHVDSGAAPQVAYAAAPSAGLAPAPAAAATQPTSLADLQTVFEDIYTRVNPSVVNVNVTMSGQSPSGFSSQGNPFGFSQPQTVQQALGSGFVWDQQGHIVTNNHVISGASTIQVTFADGSTYAAKLVGADPNSDLAVIKVNAPASELPPVTLADSAQVKVGQLVIAIGNPYGLSGTMTQGIISGLERSLPAGGDSASAQGPTYAIPDILQTDAAINPGNSGGVLLDAQGDVIGVTAAIQSPVDANSGVGFAIPSDTVKTVVTSIVKTGHYDHPWLGISGTSLTYDLAQAMKLNTNQRGALVIDVTPNSPAAKAGMQGSTQQATINGQTVPVGGDVIIAIDGHAVDSFESMASYLINNTQAGQTVTLTILRQGHQQTLQLKLGVLPAQPGA
jgi:serine protease Do